MQIWGDLAFEPDRLFAWKLFSARAQAWREFFGPAGLGVMPDEVVHTCCSQFAVQKMRIVQRGLVFFQGMQQYLATNNLTQTDIWHDKPYLTGALAQPTALQAAVSPGIKLGCAGDVATAFWHMIFGEAPRYFPPPDSAAFS